jgi:hypothetical protein
LDLDASTPISNGYQQLVAQTVNLTLAGDTLNPDFTNLAYQGLPIRISLVNEDGTTRLLFTGSVRDYRATYKPGVRRTIMELTLSDNLDTYLNTSLTVSLPVQTASARFTSIYNLMAGLGLGTHRIKMGFVATETFTAATGTFTVEELLSPILQYYAGYLSYLLPGIDPYTAISIDNTPDVGFDLSDTADQENATVQYATLTSGTDPSLVFNQVTVRDETDTVVSTLASLDNQRLYGTNSLDFVTNVSSPATNGAIYASKIIARLKSKVFVNVEIDPIENGYLSIFANGVGFYGYRSAYAVSKQINGITKNWYCVKTRYSLSIDTDGIRITMDLAEY